MSGQVPLIHPSSEAALRRGRKIAKVAMVRKLAVRLYWILGKEWDCVLLKKFDSHAGGQRRDVTPTDVTRTNVDFTQRKL
jgi:hypothetical protein